MGMTEEEKKSLNQARINEFFYAGGDKNYNAMVEASRQMNETIKAMEEGGFTRAEAIRFIAILTGSQMGNNV